MSTIRNIGSNQTLLSRDDGTEILVSYSTPVAAFVPGTGYCRTEVKHSVTTSRHVNRYLAATVGKVTIKPQSFFDELL